jgi:zinc transporter ZupT
MDQMQALAEAFDMLDIVLAVFGAVIVGLWAGRGKKVGGLLMGAVTGGLVKPMLFLAVGSGLIFAAGQNAAPEIRQTPEQQQKTLDFWLKGKT